MAINHKLFFLTSSVLGYFILTWYFLKALLFPSENIEFIYSLGVAIFFIEIINIHSTGVLFGTKEERSFKSKFASKVYLVLLYSIFYLAIFAFFSKSYYLIISSFLSFISKAFSKQALPKDSPGFYLSLFLLFLTIFLVSILAGFLKVIFPFPSYVYESKPSNTSGLFVDIPQTGMFWGFLYYSLLGISEIFFYIKKCIINPNRLRSD